MLIVLWAVLSLGIGAVLNHLADRLPRHQSLWPGPACAACGAPYAPRQWSALVAWLAGARRCKCGVALPLRRLLLELGVALLYAALAWQRGLSWELGAASFHAAVLALVAATDLETRIVPNAVVLPAAGVAIALAALRGLASMPGVLLGGGVALGLFLAAWLLHPKGMGFGDVKLAGYVGLAVGYPRVMTALLITALAGGVVAAALLLARRVGRRTYIPYAPFLALGGAIALFL
ncbi:MAG TPA: A24 family peptidase [Anaerolineae bacterium]|nr:A24 family peptidase [Anaerolineae bacterium]HOR01205.1 A24 family peptidase [Anaerolineae bacterium]HPL29341.1 A24 family peptidase [Anaerolineae bacterium]